MPAPFGTLAPLLETLGRPTRRELLRWSLLAGMSAALLQRATEAAPGKTAAATDAPRALEEPHFRTLEAVTGRILPSGDGPGAREAKVMRFLDAQLAGELRAILPAMSACAGLLEQWAQKQFAGMSYVALEPAAQDRILEQLSRGAIPAPRFPQREVYQALHTLTLEGFLSDPQHGGNEQMIAWRALGIAPMHRRNRSEAQAEDPAPAPASPRKRKLRVVE